MNELINSWVTSLAIIFCKYGNFSIILLALVNVFLGV